MSELDLLKEASQTLEYAGTAVAVSAMGLYAYSKAKGKLDEWRGEYMGEELEAFHDTLSRYHNDEIEWPHEDDVKGLLDRLDLSYNLTSRGTPENEEDLRKAQEKIKEEPVRAALDTHIINKAVKQDIDVREYLNG